MHLTEQLQLPRCPHCKIALPTLKLLSNHTTTNHAGVNARKWGVYCCTGCGGLVTAWAEPTSNMVQHVFPGILPVDRDIPERPRAYLQQASDSLHAPAGSIMLSASSVDSMLKIKNYIEGSLYKRIEQAAADHLITEEMAKWAHEVRLDANDQRHADEQADLPTTEDAQRVIDFVKALAEFLFVLPERIQRGLKPPEPKEN